MIDEAELSAILSKVLITDNEEEIDGLDEDLVEYIAGMLHSKVIEDEADEDATPESAVDEVMIPFLESVACPEDVTIKAKEAVVKLLSKSRRGAGAAAAAPCDAAPLCAGPAAVADARGDRAAAARKTRGTRPASPIQGT